MIDEEIAPIMAQRKIDSLFLQDENLRKNKELQQKIIILINEILKEAYEEWHSLRVASINSIIKIYQKSKAINGAKKRDKKYAQFRKEFYDLQKNKYIEFYKNGYKMTANNFVDWFLKNNDKKLQIPYMEQNQKNKLRQLAQRNNREFKKLLLG